MRPVCAYYGGRADGKIVACLEPVAFRCVLSWTPLVDHYCCAVHRPANGAHAAIYYVGNGSDDFGGVVVSIEAARAARLRKQAK